ncbi:MAG: phage N-6-adenine-methyltransferase [Proteobacteria bacterium]|jgi:phage N-6-adenine-methyltransferase|nr:phage N-6-adenine-methyltransferase [Pseudomonadota bacterium]
MVNFDSKFNSVKQDWETPDELFNKLDEEFHFNWDLAASESNKKCDLFYSETDNALIQEWKGSCWLNPPYGDKNGKLKDWVIKSYKESQKYCTTTIVMLIPARTNTNWWHEYCMKAKEIKFIRGRPKFSGATQGLPQPLALVVFEKHNGETRISTFDLKGV